MPIYLGNQKLNLSGIQSAYFGNTLVYSSRCDCLCFTANTAGSTVGMSITGTPTLGQNFQYSYNGHIWNTFTPTVTTITLANIGDKVYFKGNNPNGVNEDYGATVENRIYYSFVMSGTISVSGNIMSLIDNGNCNSLIIPNNYCFGGLFGICTSLTTAPTLPATTLAIGCYRSMFNGCTSLTTAPTLPATTLASDCYEYMFYGCTSLTSAPELPATTLASYCYRYMFSGCTSLTTAPTLPATTLAYRCYMAMFSGGCTSLTTAPTLPATTLAIDCYRSMFNGCTSLTTAPALPATTLANYCYYLMFNGCTSLTTAPALPATTLATSCYAGLFQGCTSLTTAPALPATTLANYCYYLMFNGCTSLTTAPALPATTLATSCYAGLFQGCTSLYASSYSSSSAKNVWRIPTSGTFLNTYSQNNMFNSCKGTRSSDVMAGQAGRSYTYYTQNTPV